MKLNENELVPLFTHFVFSKYSLCIFFVLTPFVTIIPSRLSTPSVPLVTYITRWLFKPSKVQVLSFSHRIVIVLLITNSPESENVPVVSSNVSPFEALVYAVLTSDVKIASAILPKSRCSKTIRNILKWCPNRYRERERWQDHRCCTFRLAGRCKLAVLVLVGRGVGG